MYAFKAAQSTGFLWCFEQTILQAERRDAGFCCPFGTCDSARDGGCGSVPCAAGSKCALRLPQRADLHRVNVQALAAPMSGARHVEKQNGHVVTRWTAQLVPDDRPATGMHTCATPSGAQQRIPSAPAAAQTTFNPPYLKEFPTVDQIMAQIKGSSAQDTANRQLSAMHVFGQMIAAMAGPRVPAKSIDAGRNAHHHQLLQRV